jgi:type IV pilus assembly protein PilB
MRRPDREGRIAGRLGDRLVERGCISEAQLQLALKEQERTGRRLGETLITLGFTTEQEIAASLATQSGVDYVDLSALFVEPEALAALDIQFCRDHVLLPIAVDGASIRVAMANTFDILTVDTISQMTGRRVDVVAASEPDVLATIDRLLGGDARGSLEGLIAEARRVVESQSDSRHDAGEQPVVRLVDTLIRDAFRAGATDLHVEPEERLVRIRHRVDGLLIQGPTLPKPLQGAVAARVKLMAQLDISETRVPQDGKINLEIDRRPLGMRVSSLPTVHGENLVIRLLDKSKVVVGLEDLGYSEENLRAFQTAIRRPAGIILVTGPTGSGKTTTLYAALNALNTMDMKIATLEDPVEYEMPVIRQSQVNVQAGLTFGRGLRALLRQDPDVVLVGEMRDAETVEVAIRAAMTGHLVLSTLHTNSAVGAIPRLRNMDVEPYLLSSTLVAVLAQRLVRKLCVHCRVPDEAPDEVERDALGIAPGAPLFRPGKCPRCNETGYRGRRAIAEVLTLTPKVARSVMRGLSADEIAAVAVAEGMTTMVDEARAMVLGGETTVHEALRHTWDKDMAQAGGRELSAVPIREAA